MFDLIRDSAADALKRIDTAVLSINNVAELAITGLPKRCVATPCRGLCDLGVMLRLGVRSCQPHAVPA